MISLPAPPGGFAHFRLPIEAHYQLVIFTAKLNDIGPTFHSPALALYIQYELPLDRRPPATLTQPPTMIRIFGIPYGHGMQPLQPDLSRKCSSP